MLFALYYNSDYSLVFAMVTVIISVVFVKFIVIEFIVVIDKFKWANYKIDFIAYFKPINCYLANFYC